MTLRVISSLRGAISTLSRLLQVTAEESSEVPPAIGGVSAMLRGDGIFKVLNGYGNGELAGGHGVNWSYWSRRGIGHGHPVGDLPLNLTATIVTKPLASLDPVGHHTPTNKDNLAWIGELILDADPVAQLSVGI